MPPICIGIIFLGVGIFYLFGRDALWSLKSWGDSWEGLQSKRTGSWELNASIAGVLAIIVGIVLIIMQFTQ